jgi:hypothetical protein
MSNY